MIYAQLQNARCILCIGAHADDIEIGCGGTLMAMLAANPGLTVHWVVLSAAGPRIDEARCSAERFLKDTEIRHVEIQDFRDSYFPYDGPRIKDYFHDLAARVDPDLIFTHRREDMHQDHRLTAELTWNAFRRHLILEYEIAKYEGDLGTPNMFSPLPEEIARRKIDAILDEFVTQRTKPWFSEDTFWALLRLRGVESGAPARLAEAFTCRKMLLAAQVTPQLSETIATESSLSEAPA